LSKSSFSFCYSSEHPFFGPSAYKNIEGETCDSCASCFCVLNSEESGWW